MAQTPHRGPPSTPSLGPAACRMLPQAGRALLPQRRRINSFVTSLGTPGAEQLCWAGR